MLSGLYILSLKVYFLTHYIREAGKIFERKKKLREISNFPQNTTSVSDPKIRPNIPTNK